ncbi:flagellar basal-body MS-ring/collar protein FliF [Caldinitratiruptor microaerophilus]|uniref:Flagellar M-ring protein n=1 Tax=Caldinitratiruptor microaerophilus TaxID=671077 RepID=A0AA35CJ01_9FIRM|nr:flagellar basal-body MS-ring/collar protein FliF [Caldinitratiruptor microaerophilus]BDG59349.1 hypothetical protein caldi_04390 [Caldinitratiruptor microaerophilus]
MAGWLQRAWSQARELWSRWPGWVKGLVLGLVAALVIAAVVAVPGRGPRLVPLPGQPYGGSDTALVVQKLKEAKIPYRTAPDGATLLVPEDQVLDAQLALAQAGLPRQPVGWELFDRTNLAATEFDRKVALLRAMQGELSRTIARLAPLEAAVVHLSIPEQSVFVREKKPVKAAVMVQPKPGAELSPREVDGIVRFLAASVPDLDPQNVIVIDNGGRTLAVGLRGETSPEGVPQTGDQLQAQLAFQRALEDNLQRRVLDPVFGPGNSSVMVSVRLNFQRSQTESTRFEQPQIRSRQVSEQTFSGTGTVPGLPPAGVDANAANPPTVQTPAGGTGESNFERRDETANYELNKTTTVEVVPPGRIESISVGVFVNQEVLGGATPQQLASIRDAVARASGAPVENVTIAPLPFRNPVAELFREKPAPAPERRPSPGVVVAAIAAALVLGLLLLAWMRRRRAEAVPAPAEVPAVGMGAPGPTTPVVLPEAAAAMQAAAAEEEAERILLGAEFLAQLGGDPARKRLREEVEKLVQARPEMVAQLIRAWLSEN